MFYACLLESLYSLFCDCQDLGEQFCKKQKQTNKHRVNFRVKVSEMRLFGGGGLSTALNELHGGLINGVNVDL